MITVIQQLLVLEFQLHQLGGLVAQAISQPQLLLEHPLVALAAFLEVRVVLVEHQQQRVQAVPGAHPLAALVASLEEPVVHPLAALAASLEVLVVRPLVVSLTRENPLIVRQPRPVIHPLPA